MLLQLAIPHLQKDQEPRVRNFFAPWRLRSTTADIGWYCDGLSTTLFAMLMYDVTVMSLSWVEQENKQECMVELRDFYMK